MVFRGIAMMKGKGDSKGRPGPYCVTCGSRLEEDRHRAHTMTLKGKGKGKGLGVCYPVLGKQTTIHGVVMGPYIPGIGCMAWEVDKQRAEWTPALPVMATGTEALLASQEQDGTLDITPVGKGASHKPEAPSDAGVVGAAGVGKGTPARRLAGVVGKGTGTGSQATVGKGAGGKAVATTAVGKANP